MKRKRVVVLGATGSIGESARKVARDIPERMEIVGVAANTSARKLAEQANELQPQAVCIVDESKADELRAHLTYAPQVFVGEAGLCEIATLSDAGHGPDRDHRHGRIAAGPAAIEAGKDLAVASKEILVMAGESVMGACEGKRVRVLPVDSEHNAIFQCLNGQSSDVRRPEFSPHPADRSERLSRVSSPQSPSTKPYVTRRGTWDRKSRSTPRRCSTKVSR
jgi:1-deoxy-D-xylulose-5-phosphate reductoisomerase